MKIRPWLLGALSTVAAATATAQHFAPRPAPRPYSPPRVAPYRPAPSRPAPPPARRPYTPPATYYRQPAPRYIPVPLPVPAAPRVYDARGVEVMTDRSNVSTAPGVTLGSTTVVVLTIVVLFAGLAVIGVWLLRREVAVVSREPEPPMENPDPPPALFVPGGTYQCARCASIFPVERTEEEARDEAAVLFGAAALDPDDQEILCDACFEEPKQRALRGAE